MPDETRQCLLADLGVLRISGPDARKFLQGQLSNDVQKLDASRPLLAGLHNPQGRVLALLRLWPAPDEPDAVLALLPAELLGDTATHLRRYVLRSRVQIADDSGSWHAWGMLRAEGALEWALRHASTAAPAVPGTPALPPGDVDRWHALEVAAGLPQVYGATRGEFVAQMLNLDCVGGIAWDKGCYTGQEILARAHYRGQVKRRMRRFAAASGDLPPPGATHRTGDGLEVRVVRSARTAGGECELLAVVAAGTASVDERPLPYALPAQ